MKRHTAVRGVVVNESGHILAVRHKSSALVKKKDFWAIPGGHLDPGEPITAGLMREFKEELGILPRVGRLMLVSQFLTTDHTGIKAEKLELFFHIENTNDFLSSIDTSLASHGYEIEEVGFVDPKTTNLLPKTLKELDILSHLKTNQPPIMDNEIPAA